MDLMPTGGPKGRFMSYLALVSLVLAIALPFLIAALDGEEYAALVGIALVVVALVLGIVSWGTLVGRITVVGSVVLILLVVAMGLVWAVQSR